MIAAESTAGDTAESMVRGGDSRGVTALENNGVGKCAIASINQLLMKLTSGEKSHFATKGVEYMKRYPPVGVLEVIPTPLIYWKL